MVQKGVSSWPSGLFFVHWWCLHDGMKTRLDMEKDLVSEEKGRHQRPKTKDQRRGTVHNIERIWDRHDFPFFHPLFSPLFDTTLCVFCAKAGTHRAIHPASTQGAVRDVPLMGRHWSCQSKKRGGIGQWNNGDCTFPWLQWASLRLVSFPASHLLNLCHDLSLWPGTRQRDSKKTRSSKEAQPKDVPIAMADTLSMSRWKGGRDGDQKKHTYSTMGWYDSWWRCFVYTIIIIAFVGSPFWQNQKLASRIQADDGVSKRWSSYCLVFLFCVSYYLCVFIRLYSLRILFCVSLSIYRQHIMRV